MQHVPNALTLLRLLIAPVIGALLLLVALGGWAPALWLPVALGLFLLACLTDLADGVLARRLSVESTAGAVLDPVADKLLMLCTGLGLVVLVPNLALAGAVLLMLGRDLAVGGLRELALSRGRRLPVAGLGKAKTVLQCMAFATGLAQAALTARGADVMPGGLTLALFWLAAVVSLASAVAYARGFRDGASARHDD